MFQIFWHLDALTPYKKDFSGCILMVAQDIFLRDGALIFVETAFEIEEN